MLDENDLAIMRQMLASPGDQIPISLPCSSFLALWLHEQDWTPVLSRIGASGISFQIWEQHSSEITMALVQREKQRMNGCDDSGCTKQPRESWVTFQGERHKKKWRVLVWAEKKRQNLLSTISECSHLISYPFLKKSPNKKPQTITT